MNCMEVSRYVVHRWQRPACEYSIFLPDGGRWLATPSRVVAGGGMGGGWHTGGGLPAAGREYIYIYIYVIICI